MLILGKQDLENLMQMSDVIQTVATALKEYSSGKAVTPIRTAISVPQASATALFMPSMIESVQGLGMKYVSVFPNNKKGGKQTIYGVLLLADITTGEPLALLEASSLTVLRTGAVCGLATRLLARENASSLGLIGTGAQARGIVEAILSVRSIEQIRLFNRSKEKAHIFAEDFRQRYGSQAPKLFVSQSPDQAIEDADIITTATNSSTPVFSSEYIKPGVHINAIGAYLPTMQEIPFETVTAAHRIVVESIPSVLEEAGDLILPLEAGQITSESLIEIGNIVYGSAKGRESSNEITLFKSVGLAAMDVAVAKALYDHALARKAGQIVSL